MDEDNSSPNPDKVSEQVFDISPDLNIRPITNDAPEEVPAEISDPVLKATAENLESMAKQNVTPAPIILDYYGPIAGKSAPTPVVSNKQPAPVPSVPAVSPQIPVPTPRPPIPTAAPITPPAQPLPAKQTTPAQPIPLQDISASLSKIKSSPANPPAKTIGALREDKFDQADSRHDLQSAVSSILPDGSGSQTAKKYPAGTNPGLKNLRTYEGDIADVMSHKRTSTASIAIAETKKSEGEEVISNKVDSEPSYALRNISLTILSLLLIGGGAFGAYYLYKISPLYQMIGSTPQTTPASQAQTVPSLVPADTQVVISIDKLGTQATIEKIQSEMAKTQPADSIKEIILTKTTNGAVTRVSSTDMVSLLETSAPDILTRSLAPDWMLGVYQDSNGQENMFVVATNDFFQNTFAGMLQWESSMPDDLRPYLPAITQPQANAIVPTGISTGLATSTKKTLKNATSTAVAASTTDSTSPVSAQALPIIKGRFVDRIIKNKDVREYVTTDGHVMFLYSFIDDSKLIITGNEDTLSEILARLEKQSFLR